LTFRLCVADLDSPSYFVATAAVELGFFKEEGIDIELEHAYGALDGPERLRAGEVHFLGGPAYMATRAFPGWRGARLLCGLAQYSYWFLAVRADLDVRRGDLGALKGLRISSSTAFPEVGLRHLLRQAGLDLERDRISIVPLPGTKDEHLKYRVGVAALEQNTADAYWGNGMRLAIGERLGVAKLHLDLRRGDGPQGARFYNFAALATTEGLIAERPEIAAAAVRAIVKAQAALKADPSRATPVGERLFAPEAASLIAGLIARDAPFYDAAIAADAVDGINSFAVANGLLTEPLSYDRLVATQFRDLWRG
jgi:ABC-type nitrate/sulfonate/bicarbonate transport system substrate-binding protein